MRGRAPTFCPSFRHSISVFRRLCFSSFLALASFCLHSRLSFSFLLYLAFFFLPLSRAAAAVSKKMKKKMLMLALASIFPVVALIASFLPAARFARYFEWQAGVVPRFHRALFDPLFEIDLLPLFERDGCHFMPQFERDSRFILVCPLGTELPPYCREIHPFKTYPQQKLDALGHSQKLLNKAPPASPSPAPPTHRPTGVICDMRLIEMGWSGMEFK